MMRQEASGGGQGWRSTRVPIERPAPLLSGGVAVPSRMGLPRLRWAAHCHDRHFEGGVVGSHGHDETELVFGLRGHVVVTTQGRALDLGQGDLCILPAGQLHAVASEGSWAHLCVLYSGAGPLADTAPRSLPVGTGHRLRRWIEDLCDLHARRPEAPGPAADALLLAVLAEIAELEQGGERQRSLHPRLSAAMSYLHAHAGRAVAAAELAAATGTSYSHLAALFRARLGCAPLDYHRGRRMERACQLLADPYLSVGEVARRLGFDDVSYFVRVFRKTSGAPPDRWRREAAAR